MNHRHRENRTIKPLTDQAEADEKPNGREMRSKTGSENREPKEEEESASQSVFSSAPCIQQTEEDDKTSHCPSSLLPNNSKNKNKNKDGSSQDAPTRTEMILLWSTSSSSVFSQEVHPHETASNNDSEREPSCSSGSRTKPTRLSSNTTSPDSQRNHAISANPSVISRDHHQHQSVLLHNQANARLNKQSDSPCHADMIVLLSSRSSSVFHANEDNPDLVTGVRLDKCGNSCPVVMKEENEEDTRTLLFAVRIT